MKAWVKNPEDLRVKLENLYGERGAYLKKDKYFNLSGSDDPGKRFRIRKDGAEHWITYKQKEKKGPLELNNEIEFKIEDPESFEAMMKNLGFEVFLIKVKRGTKYRTEEYLLELSEIPTLGWFLEIEILLEDPSQKDIQKATEDIQRLFDNLGIDKNDLEPRYYSDLLKERGNGET